MKNRIHLGFVLFTLFLNNLGFASSDSPPDLTAGIAFPSVNGAVRANPAGLSASDAKMVDLGARLNSGSTDFAGSVAGGNRTLGFGLEVQNINPDFVLAGGFGASSGDFSIGVSAISYLNNFSPTIDLGLRHDFHSVVLALLFKDLSNFARAWTLGLGFASSDRLRFGIDLNLSNQSSGIGVSQAEVIGYGQFYISQTFTFNIHYGAQIVPSSVMDRPGFGTEVNLWLSRSTALYGMYHPIAYGSLSRGYNYIIGAKIAL